ncbi:MAG TPA: ABC transporter ATP-binding protein [Burkholderiales bacterium]
MPLLEVQDVQAHYGSAAVLQGVTVQVHPGQVVSIFGRNGAGKTTTLKTVMGWLRPSAGEIRFEGVRIGGLTPDRVARRGIGFIPEDRRIFAGLTVEENLLLGGMKEWRAPAAERRKSLDLVYALFPRLAERRRQMGKTLSGGEQQMLAIGRALVGRPKLLLVDEPSEGLAPLVVNEIFDAMLRLRSENVALLLVEQKIRRAAEISDFCYVLEKGCVVSHGHPEAVIKDPDVRQKLSV